MSFFREAGTTFRLLSIPLRYLPSTVVLYGAYSLPIANAAEGVDRLHVLPADGIGNVEGIGR